MAQLKKSYKRDPLALFRKQLAELIDKNYRTVEEFCYTEDLQKSTMSRLLSPKSGRTEYKIATLDSIAQKLGKKLVIRLE